MLRFVGIAAIGFALVGGVSACSRAGERTGDPAKMTDTAFQNDFAIASHARGAEYLEARRRLLEADRAERPALLAAMAPVKADPSDWEAALTAEILSGWLAEEPAYAETDRFVRGELSPPAPMAGFTVRNRAAALNDLGAAAVPRVLERVWKSGEYGDETEFATLFEALSLREDRRAVLPMIALIEDPTSSPEVRGSAAAVLSRLGDPRGLPAVIGLATGPTAEPESRRRAMRSLGGFRDERASSALVSLLERADLPVEDRRAAADGLLKRSDPGTRQAVLRALQRTDDPQTRVTLVRTLARIGSADQIAALERLAGASPELKRQVSDAIEEIRDR
jgi:hypothetical protein